VTDLLVYMLHDELYVLSQREDLFSRECIHTRLACLEILSFFEEW